MEEEAKKKHTKSMRIIRNVYLYLVAMIGLIVFIIGCVSVIDNIFKNFVFKVDYNISYETYPRLGTCYQPYVDLTDKEGKKTINPTTQDTADCLQRQEEINEQSRRNQIGSDFSIAIAQLAVGLPVWLLHWGIIQKEYRRKKEEEDKE
jgi:hypothetical protein